MSNQSISYKHDPVYSLLMVDFTRICVEWFYRLASLLPRPCILASLGLILVGLCIPLLMLVGLVPTTLLLTFAGLATTITGGVLALIFCGEI